MAPILKAFEGTKVSTIEKYRNHLLAIQERRKFVESEFPSWIDTRTQKTGLVLMIPVLFKLATRYVSPNEGSGHKADDTDTLCRDHQWYSAYLKALADLVPAIQSAVRSGKIPPRSFDTKVPIALDKFLAWLDMDVNLIILKHMTYFWENRAFAPDCAQWADSAVLPWGLAVSVEDVAVWAESLGIAAPGEVKALLFSTTLTSDLAKALPATLDTKINQNRGESGNTFGSGDEVEQRAQSINWQDSARAIADECFDIDTKNNCRDSLAGYSRRVMMEMQNQNIHGPRGLFDNPRTIQREALQGKKWWACKQK